MTQGRMYTVVFENVSVAAAQDLFELTPADDKPIILHAVYIAGASSETSEQLRFTIKRLPATVTSGSGGSAPTPQPCISTDSAAGFTAEVNNTSRASTNGTALTLHAEGGNLVTGWVYQPSPPMMIGAKQTEVIIVGLEAAPSASTPVSGVAYVEELG